MKEEEKKADISESRQENFMISKKNETQYTVAIENETQYTVAIENKMMRDQRMVSATRSVNSLQTIQLKGGDQNIFAKGDINDVILRRYYPDAASLTGWSVQEIPLPGAQFYNFTHGYETDGTPRLFVATGDVSNNRTIYEVPLAADGTPGVCIKLASFVSENYPSMAFSAIGPALLWSQNGGFDNPIVIGLYGENLLTPFTPLDVGDHPFQIWDRSEIQIIPDLSGTAVMPNITLLVKNQYGNLMVIQGENFVSPGSALDCNSIILPTLTDRNNQPSPVYSYSVAAYPDGRRIIFATVQDGVVHTLQGKPDPSSPSSVIWDTAWETLDLGISDIVQMDFGVQVGLAKDGTTTLALLGFNESNFSNTLWLSEQAAAPNAPWSPAVAGTHKKVGMGRAFIDDEGDFGYSLITIDNYIYSLTRDENEDWDVELIDTEDGTTSRQVDIYRVGISVVDETNAAAVNKSITIKTDDEVEAFVNGDSHYISSDEPLTVKTDSSGFVWIMVDIVGSIAVPTFSISSDDGIFDGKIIIIKPEADAQKYTTQVSAETLQNAADDEGTPLLPASSPYTDIAANLNKLGNMMAHVYEPAEYRSERLFVPARAGVQVLERLEDAVFMPKPNGSWSIKTVNGVLTFGELTPETAAARRQALIAAVAAERGMDVNSPDFEPNSFWDDWEDAFESIGDALVQVGEIIIDGLNATVNFVIDGVSRIVEAALAGVSKLLDVVNAVLNFAGALLGRVVGWLIRAIGWLLGLPDMVAIKNRIKTDIKNAVAGLNTSLPDPLTCVTPVQNKIEEWETDLSSLIASFKTTPAGTQDNSELFGGIGSVLSAMSSGSTSISSEATWLIEKLLSALPRLGGLPDSPDIGVDGTVADLMEKAADMQAKVDTFGADLLAGGLQSWFNSLSSLDSANVDPILDAINKNSNGLLQDADGMIGDLGTILHALWLNPTVITDWLDEPINITFFSPFYKGLVGNDLSILDFLALAAALPYSVIGPDESKLETPADNQDDLVCIIYCLMGVRCLFTTVSASIQKPSVKDSNNPKLESSADTFIEVVSIALDLAIASLTLAFTKTYSRDHWITPAVIDLFISVATALATWANSRDKAKISCLSSVANGFGMAGALLGGILSASLGKFNGESLGYLSMQVISNAGFIAVDRKWINIETPPNARWGYTILQGGLSATQAILFLTDNLETDSLKLSRQ